MKKILALLLILTVLLTECAFCDDGKRPLPKLSVAGRAILHKPADAFSLNVGVVTQDADAQKALRYNSERMQAVIQALSREGLSKADYSTGRFTIRPLYTPTPRNPPADWVSKIKGYEVTNSVAVQTDKLKLSGKIIDAVNQAGANTINNIRFELKDPRQYRAEAIKAATDLAKQDAQTLADAAGLRLSRILRINLDQAQATPLNAPMNFMSKSADFNTPIEPGNVEVRAEVLVVYEIE